MAMQASWGGKTWGVDARRVAGIGSFSGGKKIKAESMDDANAGDQKNERGYEPETLSFDVVYAVAGGVDVRKEIDSWRALVGNVATMYIGGKQYGPKHWQLTDVPYTVDMVSSTGQWLVATVTFNFTEYTNTMNGVKAKTVSENSFDAALTAGPSTDEKAAKKATYYDFWGLNYG